MSADLFGKTEPVAPLAEDLRPKTLDEVVGQEHLIGPGKPLRLAFESRCYFRKGVQRRLDDAGIPWEMAVESNSTRTNEAVVSADLAVIAYLEGMESQHLERIAHGGQLPELPSVHLNLYARDPARTDAQADLVDLIRREFAASAPQRVRPEVVRAIPA